MCNITWLDRHPGPRSAIFAAFPYLPRSAVGPHFIIQRFPHSFWAWLTLETAARYGGALQASICKRDSLRVRFLHTKLVNLHLICEARLHHHLCWVYGNDALDRLSKQECLTAFQYWVHNIRAQNSSALEKEHLMCPMLWCRHSFEDEQSTLDHFAKCPWISDTWYWCSPCSRPETFMNCGASCRKAPPHSLHRKASILGKAATFFRHLGCVNLNKPKASWNTHTNISQVAKTSQHSSGPAEVASDAEVFEKSSTTYDPELSTRLSHNIQHEKAASEALPSYELASRISYAFQHELLGSATYPQLASSCLDQRIELLGDLPSGYDTESREAHPRTQGLGEWAAMPDNIGTMPVPFQPIFQSHASDGQYHSTVEAPLRTLDPARSLQKRPEPIRCLAEDHRQLWASITETARHGDINQSLDSLRFQPWKAPFSGDHFFSQWISDAGNDECSSSEDKLDPMQLPVREVHKLVIDLHKVWRQKLISTPSLFWMCSRVLVRDLFELGINALYQFFKGKLVDTFVDIFALVHVACASNYYLNIDNEVYCWGDLFHDMLEWRHAIADDGHAELFMRSVHKLCCPENLAEPLYASAAASKPPSQKLYDMLKNGRIIRICSYFLDSM